MISIVNGDITRRPTEAIVNAANASLLAGSGVSGAIHRAAGPELEAECRDIGPCPVGEARITSAYGLPNKYVIHAVPPRYWDGTKNEAAQLRRCYEAIFELAANHRIGSIAIPAIGTGIYRHPLREATCIAIEVAKKSLETVRVDVEFVCFDETVSNIYEMCLISRVPSL